MMQLATAVREKSKISAPSLLDRLAPIFTAEQRPQIAVCLGKAFAHGELAEVERLVVIKIFDLLIRDTEVEVRQALVEQIKSSPLLPRSIAVRLAKDIESVALPLLRTSEVLKDKDLISIIRESSVAKQCAIAERVAVSEAVSEALVETGKKEVVRCLLANQGAQISVASYQEVIDMLGSDEEIRALLADRYMLPLVVKQRLVCLIANGLQECLVEQHTFPEALAEQLARHGQERALIQSLSAATSMSEIEAAAKRLGASDALTPTLLLRALCSGRLDLFTASMATLTQVPLDEVRGALDEMGASGLRSLYEKSNLPAQLRKAFRIALDVVLDVRLSDASEWQQAEVDRILCKLVQAYNRLSPNGLDSILCQLDRLGPDD